MASPTQWTWVWVSSGSWWWTGKPGVRQFIGLQRVRHKWVTELRVKSYCVCYVLSRFSHVQLFVTLWPVAHQALLSMGFSRQEYWNGLPCPPPGDLPNQGLNLCLLCLLHFQVVSLPLTWPGKNYWAGWVTFGKKGWLIELMSAGSPLLRTEHKPPEHLAWDGWEKGKKIG